MRIIIGSDHAGFSLKEFIKKEISDHDFTDIGTDSRDSCDYPDFAFGVGQGVASGDFPCGIVICGSGIGVSISANKVRGVRAALCTNEYMAELSRRHNDANVLALGARVVGDDLALAIVRRWLDTPFDGGRHERRVGKISAIEEKWSCGS